MSTGSINVVLNLDSAGFSSRLAAATHGLHGLNININNTIRGSQNASHGFLSMGTSLHGLIVNAALAGEALRNIHSVTTGLMLGIANTNGEIEKMTALMKGMSAASTEAEKVNAALKDTAFVFDMARNSPVALKGLTDAFVKLKTTGIDPTKGSLQSLVDANAHFGGTEDTLKRATIAISQMASKGKVSMEELRQQLAEAIPNASQLMARGMGVSMEELIKRVSSGTVNSKQAIALMLDQMKMEFAGSAKEMMGTWTGLTSQLSTEWTIFQKNVGDAGFFEEAKNSLRDLVEVLKTEDMRAFAASFGHVLADVVKSVTNFTKYVLENRDEIGRWVKVGAEALIAFMAWTAISKVVTVLVEMVAAFRVATTTAAGTQAALAALGVSLGVVAAPIVALTTVIMLGANAWVHWGEKAENSLESVKQAVKDGVKISVDGIRAIEKAQDDARAAQKSKNIIANGGIGGTVESFKVFATSPVGRSVADTLDGVIKDAAELKANGEVGRQQDEFRSAEDFNKKLKIQAEGFSNSRALQAGADIKKLSDMKKDAGVKDIENDKGYIKGVADITAIRNKGVIDDLNQLEKKSRPEIEKINKMLNNDLTKIDPQKKKDLINEMTTVVSGIGKAEADNQKALADKSELYSPDTKKADAAAKAAAKAAAHEIERQQNIEDGLRSQLAKKISILGQPQALGGGVVGQGPEEAKIDSLKASGHAFTEETINMAKALDVANKALSDQGKAFESLSGQERNAAKNRAKSETDRKHSVDVLANGGYETMSKETLRFNDQMEITNARIEKEGEVIAKTNEQLIASASLLQDNGVTLNATKKAVDATTDAYEKRAAAVKKDTAASLNAMTEIDKNKHAGEALISAQQINASMIGGTRDRIDAEYELKRTAFLKENQLDKMGVEEIRANHKELNEQLMAMDAQRNFAHRTSFDKLMQDTVDFHQVAGDSATIFTNGMIDGFTNLAANGTQSFRQFTASVLNDISKLLIKMALLAIAQKAIGMVISAAAPSLSGAAGTGVSSLGSNAASNISGSLGSNAGAEFGTVAPGMGGFAGAGASISPNFSFAAGGVMTSMGKLPLNAYATGGVAKTPQVAIFGEGRQNEAYVPLPDGKSIPVTMKGDSTSGTNVSISINIDNKGNSDSSAKSGDSKKDGFGNTDMWAKMADGVKGIVLQTIGEQRRPGGQLYSG